MRELHVLLPRNVHISPGIHCIQRRNENHGQLMLGKCQIIVTVVLRKDIISAGIDFDRFLQLFVPLKNEVCCFQHTKYSSDTEYY